MVKLGSALSVLPGSLTGRTLYPNEVRKFQVHLHMIMYMCMYMIMYM